jgi:hypothetical protein
MIMNAISKRNKATCGLTRANGIMFIGKMDVPTFGRYCRKRKE